MVVILVVDIAFSCFGKQVFIAKGTEIFVDSATQIGCHDGQHFDIFPDEYLQIH